MDNVTEVVALHRQQAALETQIMNSGGPAVAAEWALATTRRRLVAYPEALAAVLHTARALRRTPDMVSVRDVTAFGGSNCPGISARRRIVIGWYSHGEQAHVGETR